MNTRRHLLTSLAAIILVNLPVQARGNECGQWQTVPTPVAPTGWAGGSEFRDIASLAPDNIWAVGAVRTGAPDWDTHTLIMHWDGIEWEIVPSPNPSPTINSLYAVEVITSDDVWAAGVKEIFNPFRELRPLVLHWDGISWEEIVHPALDLWGGVVRDIEVIAPDDLWLGGEAGGFLAAHWDGSGFELFPMPSFDTGNCSGTYGCGHAIEAMAAVSSDDIWAVGGAGDGDYSFVSQIIHWDGSSWTHVPGPSIPYFQRLFGVVALASDDVWAVGNLTAEDPDDNSILIVHWDGAEWSRVDTPEFAYPFGDLQDVIAFAPDDIWAAGIYTETPLPAAGMPLTMHYDGAGWTQVMPDPNGPEGAWLRGLTAADVCDLWSVGSTWHAEFGDIPHVQHLMPAETLPGLVSVASVNDHVGVGAVPIDVDINASVAANSGDVATETRLSGVTQLEIHFADVLDASVGDLNEAALDIHPTPSVAVTTSLADGDQTLIVDFTPALPNQESNTVSLTTSVVAATFATPGDRGFELRALIGNVASESGAGPQMVNAVDLGLASGIRGRFGADVADPANAPFDVNQDGLINAGDLSCVRLVCGAFGNTAP